MEGGQRLLQSIKRKKKKSRRIVLIACTAIFSLVLFYDPSRLEFRILQDEYEYEYEYGDGDEVDLNIPAGDTTSLTGILSNLQTVPKVCPPLPNLNLNQQHCPKAACVPIDRQAGLGHRLTNILAGYILSLALDLPLAIPDLEHLGGHHGSYPGANALFHLDVDADVDVDDVVVQCPTKNFPSGYDAPDGWTLHMLTKEHHTIDWFSLSSVVNGDDGDATTTTTTTSTSTSGTATQSESTTAESTTSENRSSTSTMLHINSLPYGNPNLAFTGALDDGCAAIEELRQIVANADCNTLFISGQFFSRTYLPAHEFLRSIYRGNDEEVANALLVPRNRNHDGDGYSDGDGDGDGSHSNNNYIYRDDTFNIALHIRDGGDVELSYKRRVYLQKIIPTVLEEIAPTNVPVTIYVFSENPDPHVIFMREIVASSGSSRSSSELLELEQQQQQQQQQQQVEVIGEDGELSALETFLHFMKADVFVGCDSSFSRMVNIIAGGSRSENENESGSEKERDMIKGPVVVATPNDGGDFTQNYSPGNLIGMLDGTIVPSGQIFAAAEKWKRSKMY